jgi:hypothetical protein
MRPLLFCYPVVMRTIIYVDGFNLYFGSFKSAPCSPAAQSPRAHRCT